MGRGNPVDWLLEAEQPSVRYLTLTELLGRRETDAEVREAKAAIPKRGWVAEILARRDSGGWWASPRSLYRPKYISTNWQLLALSDLGVSRRVPEVRKSCELWMARSPLGTDGVGGFSGGKGHLCYTGNMARALIRFGYGNHVGIRKAMEWLAEAANPRGGWSCFSFSPGPAKSRNLDSWEGLSAFAVYPRSRWSPKMKACVERGAEFFLERELSHQGARHAPWFRFHWPVHYYYDLLVGLDLLTRLGYGGDPRLKPALDYLERRRRPDGRWILDRNHPDGGATFERWFRAHPKQRPVPLAIEAEGEPSKMITLRALTVLSRASR